jgi:hypothetical protein
VKRERALACAIVAVALASGCAQLLGYREDYYQTTEGTDAQVSDGGEEGDQVSDAGAEGDRPPVGDAQREEDAVPGPEDSSPVDSSPNDVGVQRDGPPTFCESLSPKPLFCADFDEGEANAYDGWSYYHHTTGTLAIDTTEYLSPPAAMIANTDVVTGSGVAVDTAVYEGQFTLTGQTFAGTLDFDLRVDQVDATGGVAVLAQFGLTDGAGGGLYYLQFVTTSNGSSPLSCQVAEIYFSSGTPGMPVDHAVTSTIPLLTWTHVQLSMTVPFAGGAGTSTVHISGAAPSTSAIQVPVQKFSQTIGVGLLYASTPSNGWTILVDNVVFNATTH